MTPFSQATRPEPKPWYRSVLLLGSLVLALAFGAIWWRSYHRWDNIQIKLHDDLMFTGVSEKGYTNWYVRAGASDRPFKYLTGKVYTAQELDRQSRLRRMTRWRAVPRYTIYCRLHIPHWSLVAAVLLPWWVRCLALVHRHRRRPKAGLCPCCSYDLRAHAPGDKCPECGMVVPADIQRPPPVEHPRWRPPRWMWRMVGASAILLAVYGVYSLVRMLADRPAGIAFYGRIVDQHGQPFRQAWHRILSYSIPAPRTPDVSETVLFKGRATLREDGSFEIHEKAGAELRIGDIALTFDDGRQLSFPFEHYPDLHDASFRGRQVHPRHFNFDPKSPDFHKADRGKPVVLRLWNPRNPPDYLGTLEWAHPYTGHTGPPGIKPGDWVARCDLADPRDWRDRDREHVVPDDWPSPGLRVELVLRIREVDKERKTIAIEVRNGGIIKCAPVGYDGMAPEAGYQPQASCEIVDWGVMRGDDSFWYGPASPYDLRLRYGAGPLYHMFYVRLNQPLGISPLFAELRIPIYCNGGMRLVLALNPTGSRNLEPGGTVRPLSYPSGPWWPVLPLADAPPLTAPEPRPPREQMVRGLVKIGGRTIKTDGGTYHRVAIWSELWHELNLEVTATQGHVTLVNGKALSDEVLPPAAEPAEEDTPWRPLYPAVGVFWLRLPQAGEVELLAGTVRVAGAGNDSAELRRRLLAARYVPYVVSVDSIPVAEDASVEKILAAFEKLPPALRPFTRRFVGRPSTSASDP